jgi:hypothetical protein
VCVSLHTANAANLNNYYDPRDERPPTPRNQRRQSTLSIAMEALGGGLVIALVIVGVKRLLGW